MFPDLVSVCRLERSSFESLEGGDPTKQIDEVNLFACISIAALPLMIPFVMLLDGPSLMARWCGRGTFGEWCGGLPL